MQSTKALISLSLQGQFRHVYDSITHNDLTLDTSSAIKILVAVCNACHENKPKIDVSDLIQLIHVLLKFIQAPLNELFERYTQSAFFILKFLINKKNYDAIVQLEELLVPHFMPADITPKERGLCVNIAKSVYNVIACLCQIGDKTQNKNVLSLCFLILKMYKNLGKKDTGFEFIYNCIPALTTLNAEPEALGAFYQKLLHSTELIETSPIYTQIIKNLTILYTHFSNHEQFTVATECYKVTVAYLNQVKGSEYGLLGDIMSIAEYFISNNFHSLTRQVFVEADSALKKYHRLYKSTPKLHAVCSFVSSVVSTAPLLYKEPKLWVDNIETHSQCYQFLHNIALIMAQMPDSCICKCPAGTDLNGAVRLLSTIRRLGRLSILNRNDISWEYKTEMLFYLEKLSKFLSTLKALDCEKWEKSWLDLTMSLYGIGVHLYQTKDPEMCVSYLEKFIDHVYLHPKILDQAYLKCALSAIAEVHFERQDFARCLLITALSIIKCGYSKSEMNRWIRAKSGSRTNDPNSQLQELTLASICRRYRKEPMCLKARIDLTDEQKIELLVYELRQYQARWKSKIPMTMAFKELMQISGSELAADMFIEIWGDGDMTVHEDLPKLLHETIKKIEAGKVAKKKLLLAHLYFLRHKYRVKDSVLKHCDEMEKTMSTNRAGDAAAAMVPTDRDDECDLVSSYEILKLSRYATMMKELNNSLNLLNDWVLNHRTDDADVDGLFKLLAKIGHEYYLHGLSTKSLQAWELALRVANNSVRKLQATGFIIELADVRKPLLQKLISEAEEGIMVVQNNKNFDELITYFLCKAEAYFYVDFKIAYASFQHAQLLQKDHNCSDILQARIDLQHHKFLTLPCRYRVEGHREFSLVKIHHANNSVNKYYSDAQHISSYDMRILFDVYINLAKMHHDLNQPREVRCYAKETILLAQKMILPFRVTSLLYYLAYADVTTSRLDDGRVKIKDFSDILCLGDRVGDPIGQGRDKSQVVDILVEAFSEMMLDVPRRAAQSTCGGSPVFKVDSFELPPFLTHDENCECLYCISLEYQEFVLKVTYLKAMLFQYEDNMHLAADFFYGCLKIYECLKRTQKIYASKIGAKLSNDLVPNVRDHLVEIHCVTLMEFGYFLMRNNRLKDADKINKKVVTKMESLCLQTKLVHVYNKALLQTLTILSWPEESPPTFNFLTVEATDEETLVKTPPSRQNSVVVSPNWTTKPTKTKLRPANMPKLDLSDDDDAQPQNKKVQAKALPPPFLNLGGATPAPSTSKIKIYTGSTKKAKAVPVETTPFKKPEAVNLGTAEEKNGNHSLALRTKLLTERLKNSSRKDSAMKGEGEKNGRDGVKQNLLRKLDEAEAKPRRSARNVK